MSDETIRLGLDMGPTAKSAADAQRATAALKTEVKSTADTYDLLDHGISAVDRHMDQLVREAVAATQAQRAMNQVLRETETATIAVGAAGTRAMGQGGAGGGRGLLGFSYAFQDMTSVLTGGGGIARALGSITNNFDQMATTMGASVATAAKLSLAFTGLVAVLPMVTPLVEAFWKSMFGGGEGPEPVVKAMDAVEERLKEIRAEFEAIMKLKPFEERETQQRIKEYFGEVGSKRVAGAVAGAIGATGRGAQRTEQEQAQIGGMEQMLAGGGATIQIGNDPQTGAPIMVSREQFARELEQAREKAQERINAANVEAAGKLIGKAPTDRGARQTIGELARQVPGAFPRGFGAELGELEPEAVARQEEEVTAAEEQGRRLHQAGQRRQAIADVNRQAPDLMKGPVEQFRRQQAEQLKAGKDAMQEATDEFRDLQRQQEQEARALQQEAMGAAAPAETPKARAHRQVGQEASRVSEQMGFGTPTAEQASELADQAIRNIANGMNASAALQGAVLQKMEAMNQAAAKFAEMQQRFMGRLQASPWPTGLPR